jgi:hypothetical protein
LFEPPDKMKSTPWTGDLETLEKMKCLRSATYSVPGGIPFGESVAYGPRIAFRVTAEGYDKYEIKLYIGSDMLTQIHVKSCSASGE